LHPDFDADDAKRRIKDSIETKVVFSREKCEEIEDRILEVCKKGDRGYYKPLTVDSAPLRNRSADEVA
jgi:hypothetical protein